MRTNARLTPHALGLWVFAAVLALFLAFWEARCSEPGARVPGPGHEAGDAGRPPVEEIEVLWRD